MNQTIFKLDQIENTANSIINEGYTQKIWLFYGEMGAGKTTLISELCRQLGVESSIQSPTFSIVNEYVTNTGNHIYHFDCYRLKNEHEAFDIGIEEYLYSGDYCLIEWPEKIENMLPKNVLSIKIEAVSEFERQVNIH